MVETRQAGLVPIPRGAPLSLVLSLFVGQMFSVVGALLIASQSVPATIVKTTVFGFIVSFLLIPFIPVLLHQRPWWSVAMPAGRMETAILVAGPSGFPGLLANLVMGLMYGVLAWRSGSLWMSDGVHLGNNWFITMFVGTLVQVLVAIRLAEVVMRKKRLTRLQALASSDG